MRSGTDEPHDEPRRLADTGTSPSAQMIRAVRLIEASPSAKHRLLRRLSWFTFVSLLSSFARDASAALSGTAAVLITGLGVAVGVGVYAWNAPPPSATQPALQVAPTTSTPPPVTLPDPVRAEPAPGADGKVGLESDSGAVVAPKAGAARKPAEPPLSEEIRLIDSARSAVRNARAAEALSHLDQYGERFPKGRFSLEASALRIEALAALGKRVQARTLAQRFIQLHPRSLLVERVSPYAEGP